MRQVLTVWAFVGGLFFVCAGVPPVFAVDANVPVVGHGEADLAVRAAAESAWRLVEQGEQLPAQGAVRAAGPGLRLVTLGSVKLQIEGGTTLQVDAPKRQITVIAGRVGVAGGDGSDWRIVAGDVSAPMAANSRSVWSRSALGASEVHLLAGNLGIQASGASVSLTAAAPLSVVQDAAQKKIATRALAPADQQRLAATFHDRPAPQGLGQLVVEDAQAGTAQRLEVARYHVNVVLQPPVALVQIDQSFYNPFPRQMEGTFVFNLPSGAAVSRFAMYVTREQLIEGELIERQRANQIYTSIVTARRDPAILEEIGNNLFRMRVFPIFAQDTKQILLDYTVPLEPQSDQYKFRLPLFSDLKPIWDFSVTGQLNGDAVPESLVCPTHSQLEIRREKSQASWKWSERDYKPQSDLVLSFRARDEKQVTVRTQLAPALQQPEAQVTGKGSVARDPRASQDTTYFMLTVPPAWANDAKAAPTPADVLLLVDTSHHAKDRAAYLATARTVLRHLRPEDRLRVAVVDVNHRWLHEDWLRGGSADAERVLGKLAEQYPLGRAVPTRAIAEAVQDAFGKKAGAGDAADSRGPAHRRLVLWLAEGSETKLVPVQPAPAAFPVGGLFQVGPQPARAMVEAQASVDTAALAPKLQSAGVQFTALVAGTGLASIAEGPKRLDDLATASNGQVFDVQTAAERSRFYDWLLAGMPSSTRVEALEVAGALDEEFLYPKSWLPGQPLRVYGRAGRAAALELRMTIQRDGQSREHRQTLQVANDDALFVGRTWAQQRIARWRDEDLPGKTATEDLRRRMIAVSQEWSVLSPYTAFLVLETEQDYARWNIDRKTRRVYWKPRGAEPSRELPAEWLARIKQDQKAAREETRLSAALARAQEQLAQGNFAQAYWHLAEVGAVVQGDQRLELERLRQAAQAGLVRESARRQVSREFPIFDPAGRGFSEAAPWSRYVLPSATDSTDVPGSRFARQLSKRVTIAELPPFTLRKLADWIELSTGVPVDLDRKALDRTALDGDFPVSVTGAGEISIGSYLAFVARQLDLRVLEDPDRLLLTSSEEYQRHLVTEVYPVDDLLFSEGVPSPAQLRLSPTETRRRTAANRLRAKLKEPLTTELLPGVRLADAAEHLAQKLSVPIFLDRRALEEAGIRLDRPVEQVRVRGIPAGLALRRMLRDLDLTYVVHDEAILVTTPEEAGNLADVRIYSGRELVHLDRVPSWDYLDNSTQPPTVRRDWWPNGLWPRGGDQSYASRPFVTSAIPAIGPGGGFFGGGGLGGGGFGGFGGGLGGGTGGLGGVALGGGGFLGGSPAPPSATALSSGGDGQSAPPPAAVPGSVPAVTSAPADSAPNRPKPPTLAPNPWPILNLVMTSTGKPEPDWEDNGGVGSVDYFDPTFDFVVRTTEEVHEQVSALFERLAKLPKPGIPAAQATLTSPKIGRDQTDLIDWSYLTDLVAKMTARPEPGWVDEGGVNTLEADGARMALVANAVQSSHEELHTLLTLLRRSRYEARFGSRPWEIDELRLFGDIPVVDPAKAARPVFKATPEELARLSVRRLPQVGRWRWQRSDLGGKPQPLALALDLEANRIEFMAPNRHLRVDAQQAAEAHTDLGTVVLHRDVDAVGLHLDNALPWWPHRSNEELAAIYRVDDLPQESNDRQTVLRFVPRIANDPAVAFVKATLERQSGRLIQLEFHLDGKLVGQLVLTPAALAGGNETVHAVLSDASGHRLVEWKAIEPEAASGPLQPVDAGWESFVVLDRRSTQPRLDADYHAIVAAMSQSDWRAAYGQLQRAIQTRPARPILRMLRGVCVLNDSNLAPRTQAIGDLQEATASSASGIALALATQPQFEERLSPTELESILTRQPEAQRRTEVWLRLARLAQAMGDTKRALQHARRAWSLAVEHHGGAADLLETHANRRFLVTLLLTEGQTAEARRVADEFLASGRATLDQLFLLTDVFAQQGQRAQALDILESQLRKAQPHAAPERYRLVRRAADYAEGPTRAQLLYESLQVPGEGAASRADDIELMAAALTSPSDVAKLAAQTTDRALRGRLLYAQALLTSTAPVSGKLVLQALELAPMPGDLEDAVTARLVDAGLVPQYVDWLERELRAGRENFGATLWTRFAWSLRKVGREREAERVGQ